MLIRSDCSWVNALCAAGLATVIVAAGVAKADVLYDRTDMTDDQTFNQVYTSSITLFNGGWDRQLADNFELDDTHTITIVTADMRDNLPADIPGEGFLVEFFPNETENCVGGDSPPCPGEVPFAAAFSPSFTATPLLDIGENWHRYTIDLTNADIALGPGIWWISIVAVDESGEVSSLERYNILVTNGLPKGVPVAGRAGGVDHGNGYQGGTSSDWHHAIFGPGDPTPSDAAIRIEGTLVPPPCPWNCGGDNDNAVGIIDFLELLGQWGGPGPCDLDGGGVGITDFLELLANWGPCP